MPLLPQSLRDRVDRATCTDNPLCCAVICAELARMVPAAEGTGSAPGRTSPEPGRDSSVPLAAVTNENFRLYTVKIFIVDVVAKNPARGAQRTPQAQNPSICKSCDLASWHTLGHQVCLSARVRIVALYKIYNYSISSDF